MNKKSFFEYIIGGALHRFLRLLSWFSSKIGNHSLLAAISNKGNRNVAFVSWVIFMFTFLLSFLFLFKQHLLITIGFAVGYGCLVIAYGSSRIREVMMGSFPVKWIVRLLDPNK
ncbi:hypothetical protein BEP19_05210 [Ammoniphilus oxalaticus]|uniref:Uncharacterized protein n=1 Tax=Ammoniphilus oxalaticus TaxID=66863 RepID=A0A419SIP7_9BACL|nr:hypothetical protein [Ammoniphilus oxalaticus]RKD23829.1 hypothetical protein BEP19_05210 [Ammoniphilus oxalaticus]